MGEAAQVDKLVGSIIKRFGKLDILVNNAGAPVRIESRSSIRMSRCGTTSSV